MLIVSGCQVDLRLLNLPVNRIANTYLISTWQVLPCCQLREFTQFIPGGGITASVRTEM